MRRTRRETGRSARNEGLTRTLATARDGDGRDDDAVGAVARGARGGGGGGGGGRASRRARTRRERVDGNGCGCDVEPGGRCARDRS